MAQAMKHKVACVYRSGGDTYTLEYVRRLAESLRQFGPSDLEIVCLSDDPGVLDYVDRHIPLGDLPTWWAKLELFKHLDEAVYFDLDTVIRGDYSQIFRVDHRFSMLTDFYHPKFPASGVMAWKGNYSYLFDEFDIKFESEYKKTGKWGDQGWISDRLRFEPDRIQDLIPGFTASYKVGYTSEPVICFHGKPRPHTVNWRV